MGTWTSAGNHRYRVSVPAGAPRRAAWEVLLEWHRADIDPASRGTVVLDAATQLPVAKCVRMNVTAEAGRFFFSGVPGRIYHFYFMPFQTCEFPNGSCAFGQTDGLEAMVQYGAFKGSCSDAAWWQEGDVGKASAEELEARTPFDAFGPMERTAPESAARELLHRAGGVVLATEDRSNPIRMLDRVPLEWTQRDATSLRSFEGRARPGEAYSFQVGVASSEALTVEHAGLASPLLGPDGVALPDSSLRCLNLQGVDYWGRPFTKNLTVHAFGVAALWFILDVPVDVVPGSYHGSLQVTTSRGTHSVTLSLQFDGPPLKNHGFDDTWRGARLSWIDSTRGNEGDVPPPYVPLSVSGRVITMLDKVVEIDRSGLLASVSVGGSETLAAPMRFEVIINDEAVEVPMALSVDSAANLSLTWSASGSGTGVSVGLSAYMDATGYADFAISVATQQPHEVQLTMPSCVSNALYGMGLGRPGGFLERWFPNKESVKWRWDGVNGNNAVWIGSTSSGLRLSPKGDDPLWQAAVPFDSLSAPAAPISWSNGGLGGVAVWPNGTAVVFTGPRSGGNTTYRFSLLATPVRPLNLSKHFAERYAHLSGPVNFSRLRDGGATVVTIHQGSELNPWINYPYLTNSVLRAASRECHALGMKLKVYNTMRELSNHALEFWALRALNETFVWRDSEGGGGDWLREHVRNGYSVAWATPQGFDNSRMDQAVRVNALSRWNNYYVEGLHQIQQDYDCDGIYLDEIAFDRVTMRRAKTVLGREGLVDHHSDKGGFVTSPAVSYLELFPFIDSLWYGEGFDYDNATPDFWLVEISGLPFGLASDMLRYSGMTPFHFRGMLFASANRWQDNLAQPGTAEEFDPRAIWGLWASFGISGAKMYGWWLADEGGRLPVTTNSSEVKCTVYAKRDRALLALANFGSEPAAVVLNFDWGLLALHPEGMWLRAPALVPMQPFERTWALQDVIVVPAAHKGSPTSREGWLLLLEHSEQELEV